MKYFTQLREEATDGTEAQGMGGEAAVETPSWYYSTPNEETQAEGVAGNGDVPEWMLVDKYKSVEEQAKAYPELAKRFGDFTGSPEEYSLPEGIEADTLDNGMIDILKSIGKENQMGQGVFNDIVSKVNEYQAEQAEQAQAQAMADLGDKAQERIQNVQNWLNTNAPKEMVEIIAPMATSASAIEALEFFIGKSKNTSLANTEAQQPTVTNERDYAEALMKKDAHGNLLMSVDPQYKKKIDAMTASRIA